MKVLFGTCVFIVAMAIIDSNLMMAQCMPPLIPPDCDNCAPWQKYDVTVCHGSVNYTATIELCTQYAVPPYPIENPCTPGCARAVDAITWVRSFCVSQDLKNMGEGALLGAIVRNTNLCCPDIDFINVVIPECAPGYMCNKSPAAYCHILAMPRCMNNNYVTGCYEKCLDCKEFCMIERRYCKPTPTTCCKFYGEAWTCAYLEDVDECTSLCNKQFNCGADYFKGVSDACCN